MRVNKHICPSPDEPSGHPDCSWHFNHTGRDQVAENPTGFLTHKTQYWVTGWGCCLIMSTTHAEMLLNTVSSYLGKVNLDPYFQTGYSLYTHWDGVTVLGEALMNLKRWELGKAVVSIWDSHNRIISKNDGLSLCYSFLSSITKLAV